MKQADVMKILDLLKSIENKHDTLKLRHDMLLQLVTALQSRVTNLENRIFLNYPIASPAYPPNYLPGVIASPAYPPNYLPGVPYLYNGAASVSVTKGK